MDATATAVVSTMPLTAWVHFTSAAGLLPTVACDSLTAPTKGDRLILAMSASAEAMSPAARRAVSRGPLGAAASRSDFLAAITSPAGCTNDSVTQPAGTRM